MAKLKKGQKTCVFLGETFKVLTVVGYQSIAPPVVLCTNPNQATAWPRFPVAESTLLEGMDEFYSQFGQVL